MRPNSARDAAVAFLANCDKPTKAIWSTTFTTYQGIEK